MGIAQIELYQALSTDITTRKYNFDISKIAPYVNSNNIIKIISLFEETRYKFSRNGNEKMLFTNLALRLTKFINLPAN